MSNAKHKNLRRRLRNDIGGVQRDGVDADPSDVRVWDSGQGRRPARGPRWAYPVAALAITACLIALGFSVSPSGHTPAETPELTETLARDISALLYQPVDASTVTLTDRAPAEVIVTNRGAGRWRTVTFDDVRGTYLPVSLTTRVAGMTLTYTVSATPPSVLLQNGEWQVLQQHLETMGYTAADSEAGALSRLPINLTQATLVADGGTPKELFKLARASLLVLAYPATAPNGKTVYAPVGWYWWADTPSILSDARDLQPISSNPSPTAAPNLEISLAMALRQLVGRSNLPVYGPEQYPGQGQPGNLTQVTKVLLKSPHPGYILAFTDGGQELGQYMVEAFDSASAAASAIPTMAEHPIPPPVPVGARAMPLKDGITATQFPASSIGAGMAGYQWREGRWLMAVEYQAGTPLSAVLPVASRIAAFCHSSFLPTPSTSGLLVATVSRTGQVWVSLGWDQGNLGFGTKSIGTTLDPNPNRTYLEALRMAVTTTRYSP